MRGGREGVMWIGMGWRWGDWEGKGRGGEGNLEGKGNGRSILAGRTVGYTPCCERDCRYGVLTSMIWQRTYAGGSRVGD